MKRSTAKSRKTGTDWARLKRMTDAEISAAIKRDPDARETTPEFLRGGRVVDPADRKQSVTIRLDTDVVRFFSSEGPGYQTRINTVLRDYVRRRRTG
jgi:uncharacterized protein (DUF4415 family)